MTASTASTLGVTLTSRDRAILRAVAAGDAELTSTADLLLGGRWCCDQHAVYRLTEAGLIAAVTPCRGGQRAAATVTAAGRRELAGAAS